MKLRLNGINCLYRFKGAELSSESKTDAPKVKAKLVRDSFTMPKQEYAQITGVKQRAAKLGRPTKKSEVLRAAVALLSALPDGALLAALQALASIKTGRPKASEAAALAVEVAQPAKKQAAKPAAKKVTRKVAAKRAPASKSA